MSTAETAESLLELAQAGRAPAFITAASRALTDGLPDDQVRLELVRALVQQGLFARARQVATALGEGVRCTSGFQALLEHLERTAQTGRVPWTSCRRRFEANVRALGGHGALAEAVVQAWERHGDRLELHRTAARCLEVFEPRGPADGLWRPAFGNHTPDASAAALRDRLRGRVLAPLVLEGVGLGHFVPWAYAATQDLLNGWSATLYVIEPSYLALAVALHLSDWRAALADPRVQLCCGPDAYVLFEAHVTANRWQVAPRAVTEIGLWEPVSGPGAAPRCRALQEREREREAHALARTAALYRGRDVRWWAGRYRDARAGSQPPLRVLGITTRFSTVVQYAMRDALAALAQHGCETRLLIEPHGTACLPPLVRLEAIREFTPDLILLINHLRNGAFEVRVADVPVATWVQDRVAPIFNESLRARLGPLDFGFGMGAAELLYRCGWPADQFLPTEMAPSPAVFAPVSPNATLAGDENAGLEFDTSDDRYACDVAFASNFSGTAETLHASLRARADGGGLRLIDAVYDDLRSRAAEQRLDGGLWPERYLARRADELHVTLTGDDLHRIAAEYVRPLADRMLRLETLEWAADWACARERRLHLYGRSWESHPRFAAHARGFIPHGPALGRAFRGAAVHLHAGCNHAFHQRVLDGLAAGGFFLLRWHAVDGGAPVHEAAYRWLQQTGRMPPLCFHWRDLPPELGARVRDLRDRCGLAPDGAIELGAADFAEFARTYDQHENLTAVQFWPEYPQVVFSSREELFARLDEFVPDEDRRRRIAARMRARTLARFGYATLMERLLDWLTERLDARASGAATAGPRGRTAPPAGAIA